MLDETEFLSEYGVRALSRSHLASPFVLDCHGHRLSVGYEPGESATDLWGGNSNWRGPVWFPVNYLIIEALDSHAYWQLSDPLYRNSGFVMDPGSNDPEMRKQLKATNKLHDQLQGEINMLDGILHDCRKKDR